MGEWFMDETTIAGKAYAFVFWRTGDSRTDFADTVSSFAVAVRDV